jgi:hypothetical protein
MDQVVNFEIMPRVSDDLDFKPHEYSYNCGNTAAVGLSTKRYCGY